MNSERRSLRSELCSGERGGRFGPLGPTPTFTRRSTPNEANERGKQPPGPIRESDAAAPLTDEQQKWWQS